MFNLCIYTAIFMMIKQVDCNNLAFSKTFCFTLKEKKAYLVEHFLGKFFLHAQIMKIRTGEGKKCNFHIMCAETL